MSNPAVAPRSTVTPSQKDALMPDAHAHYAYAAPVAGHAKNAWEEEMAEAQNLSKAVERLGGLDLEWGEPIVIPKEFTVEPTAHQTSKPLRATAKKGKVTFRKRTGAAFNVANAGFAKLPEPLRSAVRERAEEVVLADGGAEMTIGRLLEACPRVGDTVRKPVTRAEALIGWQEEIGPLGDTVAFEVYTSPEERTIYKLYGEEGEPDVVRANLKAGNGYPVLGKGNDPEAKALYLPLAEQVIEELDAAYAADKLHGVRLWKERCERERPWLVALQGKAKGDYIKTTKLRQLKLRFYNAMGRQIMMVIQQATQRLEDLCESILDGGLNRSSAGISLNAGGAAKLVARLDELLRLYEWAHTRMGDDSIFLMLVVQDGVECLLRLALDASNYDLTQHADTTEHIHAVLLEILSLIDPVRAQLLHAYQRRRLVVLLLTVAAFMRHSGPSGLPLQSKVNGVLMGVALKRLKEKLERARNYHEPTVAAAILEVGDELGLVLRIEQYGLFPIENTEAEVRPFEVSLTRAPFLYLGYNFYKEDGVVSVYCDVPRAMAQLRYPSLAWVLDRNDLNRFEAARLGATLLAFGRPTRALSPAFAAMRVVCMQLLDEEITRNGDYLDERLIWATRLGVQVGEMGVTLGSLGALRRQLAAGYDDFWLAEPGAGVDLSPVHEDGAEEVVWTTALARLPPMPRLNPPTRKPTSRTAGRNPNTKVFAPALPPRPPRLPAARAVVDEDEAQAQAWADRHLLFGTWSQPPSEAAVSDYAASEMSDERRGRLMDDTEVENHLDDERWRI